MQEPDETAESLIARAATLLRRGEIEAALAIATKASTTESAGAFNILGLCFLAAGRLREAAAAFKRATESKPVLAEAFFNLGTAMARLGLDAEAGAAFAGAIGAVSRSSQALVALGNALRGQTQAKLALECAERAIALDPHDAGAEVLAAGALVLLGQADVARSHSERALALAPNSATARSTHASVLQSLGHFAEARTNNLRAIELDRKLAEPYAAISFNQGRSEVDRALLERMEGLAGDPSLPVSDVEMLHYGLARSYEQLEEYERSTRHYDEANRLARLIKFGRLKLSEEARRAQNDFIKGLFTSRSLENLSKAGVDSNLPILIVGMPRSGTTLVEQILSSHPWVAGAGELSFWAENSAKALDPGARGIDGAALREVAREYLSRLSSLAPNAQRVTDKMPANSTFLGFIRAGLPNSKVIRVRRNGADTCFSIYATPNAARLEFLHDKGSIAFEYEMHESLMNHWRNVFPADWFIEISYEELVEGREKVTRMLLEFCGLPWCELCLSPENNARAVATPSLWQVRQPIYRSSVGRWRNFAPWIPEFRNLA